MADETSQQEISASDNSALWDKGNEALSKFLSDGLTIFSRSDDQPATEEELTSLLVYINDFSSAINALAEVTPPSEQAILHHALLPIYLKMPECMAGIRDAMIADDPWELDLEWHKLALLLNETSEVLQILDITPEMLSGVTTTTTQTTPTDEQSDTSEGSGFSIGKFEITEDDGSGLTPHGFVFLFAVLWGIFFLIMGQVYTYRLKRLSRDHPTSKAGTHG